MQVYLLTKLIEYWSTYGIIKIGSDSSVTNGDTFSKPPLQYTGTRPAISGASVYCRVVISRECKVHNGVTGAPPPDSEGGSDFKEIEIDEPSEIYNGAFDSIATKKEVGL
jgi:hypothetical protein